MVTARDIVRVVGPQPGRHLLDIGCGLGMNSLAMLTTHAEMEATLLDLAPMLVAARDVVGATPVASRIRFRAGDYLAGDFGGEYDLVLVSHVSRGDSPADVARLFANAWSSLVPGGRVLVLDRGAGGERGYRRFEYTDMLERAGFDDVQFDAVSTATLVSAIKPR